MDSQDARINTQRYRLSTTFAIIAISFMERMSKFVIITNIVLYLMATHDKRLEMAVENSYLAEGFASMVPLVGAFVVNKLFNRRFILTVLSSIVYFMGLIILAMREIFPSLRSYNMTYVLSAVMICLGVGGLKPCVDTLGGDQKINVWKFRLEIFGVAFFSLMVDIIGWRDTYSALGVCMFTCIMIFICLGNETYQQATPEHSDVDRNSPHDINVRMFLLWLTCMMFGVFNVQTSTLFSVQSSSLGRQDEISPMSIYFVSLILIKPLIIFLDENVIPFFSTTNKISILKRLVFGMIFVCVAMILAAIVEKKRLAEASGLETGDDRKVGPVRVTVFWILPQAMLLAAADTFIFIGVEEYLSDHFPSSSVNLATTFYTSAIGAGSLASYVLIKIVNTITQENGKSWIDQDLDSSKIYKVYELLIALSFGPIILVLIGWKCFFRSLDIEQDIGMRATPVFSVAL